MTRRPSARPPRAVVFLNGEYTSAAFDRRLAATADLLLAADGGAARLDAVGMRPDVVVGDLDSLDERTASRLTAAGVRFRRHPVRKDQTDAELTVAEARAAGAGSIVLAGGAAGALDHVLGHLAVLRHLALEGVEACLVDERLWATVVVGPATLRMGGMNGSRVSLLSVSDEAVVTLRGFEYELERGRLAGQTCRGVGNSAAGPRQSVCVHEGIVLVLVIADGLCVSSRRGRDR